MSRRLQPCGFENIHDFRRHDGTADDLLHGQVSLRRGLARARRALRERRPDGLKKTHLVADFSRFVAGGCEGERLGERQNSVVEAAMRAFLAFLGRFPGRLALLHVEHPLDRAGKGSEPLLRRAAKPGAVVETVEHVAHDLVLLQQHGDGLGLVDARVFLVVAGILAEGRFQVLGDADVVHDQPGWLVAEHPVHAGDRLHEAMPPHGLVNVHRVHARRVEAG